MKKSINSIHIAAPMLGLQNEYNRGKIVPSPVFKEQELAILTHGGIFHADEVCAIALLIVSHNPSFVNIYRAPRKELDSGKFAVASSRGLKQLVTDNTEANFFVLDCLGTYDTDEFFFDHHQNAELEATNVLIAQHEFTEDYFKFIKDFLYRVSDVDRNRSGLEEVEQPTEITAIIRSLNSVENGFILAVTMLVKYFVSTINQYNKYIVSRKSYINMERVGNIKFTTTPMRLVNWQPDAKDEEVDVIVLPDGESDSDGYIALSRSTKDYIIPEDGDHSFRHNSGFLAKYPSLIVALKSLNAISISK